MGQEWSWAESNGLATKEQTEQAYNALVNKDLCSLFNREVWNDLVNLLKSSLDGYQIIKSIAIYLCPTLTVS